MWWRTKNDNYEVCLKAAYSNLIQLFVVWYLPIKTDTSSMDFDLDIGNPEGEGFGKNGEGGEVNQRGKVKQMQPV